MTKPIDRAAMKAQTRELLQTAQVSPKGMTALYCACLFLLSLLEALIPGPELVSTFLSILTTLAEWILAAGFAFYCMDIRRRERSEYAVLFDGFSFTGKIIALNIVINLFVFLWSMLFVFPGIIAYYRYSFALYNLYEDPEMDIMEDLSYMGWILLSILPSLFFTSQAILTLGFSGMDPYAALAAPMPLWQILTASAFVYALSIFYLPNYQCVQLAYFDAAKEDMPEFRSRRTDLPGGPDAF